MCIDRQLVLGFLVVKTHGTVRMEPMICDWKFGTEDYKLEDGEELIGNIPAPFGLYMVYGETDEEPVYLGFEFPGTENIDWEKEFLRLKKLQRNMFLIKS